jgi:ATP-dependent DNA helicase PIF1
LVGDFYQLPPVGNVADETTSKFCFESKLWNTTFRKENQIQLTHIFRQNDPLYKSILMEIRSGKISENSIEVLNNKVCDTTIHHCTKIFPKKKDVERVNQDYYNTLDKTDSYTYSTKVSYDNDTHIENKAPINSYMLKQYQKYTQQQKEIETNILLNSVPVNHIIHLRKGTRVMCCVNLDMEKGICNGSQGIVLDFQHHEGKKYPIVKYDNGLIETMFQYTWQSESCPIICIQQIPLMWAWAITIHKIQGATLDCAQIDIGKQVFECGQTYVALSRIRSLDGLHISSFDPLTIHANPKVIEYYNQLLDIRLDTSLARKEENTKKMKKNTKVIIQDTSNNSKISQFFTVKKV